METVHLLVTLIIVPFVVYFFYREYQSWQFKKDTISHLLVISFFIILLVGLYSISTWYPSWQFKKDTNITQEPNATNDTNYTNDTFRIKEATLESQYRTLGVQVIGGVLAILPGFGR